MSIPDLDAASTSAGSAKALVKGLALVDLVADSGRPLRLVDLVEASGVPRPTALRLLEVLCRAEVLRVDADGRYGLGPRVAAWGQSFLDRLDLRSQAVDLMEELVDISGETCFLGVVDNQQVLYLAAVNSPQPVRPSARPGFRNPLHCTGIGKVLLSGMADADVRGLLVPPLERRTENTITDPDAVLAHLARVRERGYAIDEIENEEGVRCVAAPVRDHTGAVIAGLSVSAPAYRFSTDDLHRLAPDVLRVTAELSRRLGGLPPTASGTDRPSPTTSERSTR
ncbi:IclR family transcriptional regulator [Blastococcus sp. PRF04-17]|uniref:IclR family transcriptional regulator n=1 Tax=Blastococcus sp. PRF04-17 TaxID=2933797 RepID=UPI001FF27CCF|nr:IclR family transcriptional regulator [Blastococcus sp. PRF04-17]UOY00135.1 IclR family transcriptional regulator [Blastococcus sp. PRF04-17]